MADAKVFSIIVIIWRGWSLATGKGSVCTFPLWNHKLMPYGLSNLHSVLHSCRCTLNLIQCSECLIPTLFKALRWDCSFGHFSWGSCSCGDYCRGWYRILIWLCSKRDTSSSDVFKEESTCCGLRCGGGRRRVNHLRSFPEEVGFGDRSWKTSRMF